jgi:hypothetical protein
MPPLSVDQCEACFPPTVDTTEGYELRSTRTSEGTGFAGDRCAQATDSLRLRPVGLAYAVRAAKTEFEASWKQWKAWANMEGAPQDGRGRHSGITRAREAPGSSSVALAPQSQGFAADETVSCVDETRLKQRACSMAAGSVLTKLPLRHPPHPCPGVDVLRTIRR